MDSLSERFAGQLPETAFSAFRERLEVRRELARDELNDPELAPVVAAELSAARSRIGEWRLKASGWDAIGPGLGRTYRQGRQAFRGVRTGSEVEHLHEWRKRAKDLWYELRLLARVCGPAVRGQAKEAHRLPGRADAAHPHPILAQRDRLDPQLGKYSVGGAIPVFGFGLDEHHLWAHFDGLVGGTGQTNAQVAGQPPRALACPQRQTTEA